MAKKPAETPVVPEGNSHILLSMNYDAKLLLPFKEAVQLLALLENAELVKSNLYQVNNRETIQFESNNIKFETVVIGRKQYQDSKIAQLLLIDEEEEKTDAG